MYIINIFLKYSLKINLINENLIKIINIIINIIISIMIIPVRCFTCNKVLGSKYATYLKLNQINKPIEEDIVSSLDDTEDFNKKLENSRELFEKLGIKRYCCKRHLLTHVDLIEKI